MATPIMVAPTGRHKLLHPDGEIATAEGAAAAGSVMVLSTFSTVSIEEVASVGGALWFQLYLTRDGGLNREFVDRAGAAGCQALVLTVDQPIYGWSPRAARHPVQPSDEVRHANFPGAPIARTAYDPSFRDTAYAGATFRDLEWLVGRSSVDVVVKGVLRGDEARRCIDAGARAIIVSNHGGRHLDTAVPTAHALPEVVAAAGDRAEIYVDGGIRRGTDIVKALALGARGVLVGRPPLWGLAAGGAEGVTAVLDHLRDEFARAMRLCGATSSADIEGDLLWGEPFDRRGQRA